MNDRLMAVVLVFAAVGTVLVLVFSLLDMTTPRPIPVETSVSETSVVLIASCVDEARKGVTPAGTTSNMTTPDARALANCLQRFGLLRESEGRP